MIRHRLKFLFTALMFLSLGYMFSGGDCGTDNDPDPVTAIAAPTNVNVSLSQASGHFATITWNHSGDNGRSDFRGYRVVTYEVDTANNIISTFNAVTTPKTATSQAINSITPLKRYITYVTAELNNDVKSDSVATKTYAAVFENEGSIDEYQATGSAMSGYGWETSFGVGTQYAYTGANAGSIDMHVRNSGSGLRFVSPNENSPGTKTTLFELVGQGQSSFDQTNLNEPAATSLAVVSDNVYLLKLQSGHYVKVWVNEIVSTSGYQTINFTYKLQPIAGLRVLKR